MECNTNISQPQIIRLNIFNFESDIIWSAVFELFLLHVVGIYGILTFNYLENPMTTSWIFLMYIISNIGVSGGAHRLWSHRSYEAKLPLRIILLIFYSSSVQLSLCNWVKNHRMHHKYCDTDADPHTTKRGYFYTHIGWLMMKEHPEYVKKIGQIDLSDVLSDPVIIFGERYCLHLQLLFGFILPTLVPVYLWNETWIRAIISQIFIRYLLVLHAVWTVNSIAHAWGTRPYDKNIKPANNNFVNFVALGEGYHNFHHAFPWDYRSSEKGHNILNYTTFFINFFAKLGQAYDLKYPSEDLVRRVVLQRGDGTHPIFSEVPRPESK